MIAIIPLAEASDSPVALVGNKAHQLGWALARGWPVPAGFAVPAGGEADVAAAYDALGGGVVAVRSSGALEDGRTESYAGRYASVLNVSGLEALHAAICTVRASGPDLTVLVQKQIHPSIAGVLFTTDSQDSTGTHAVAEWTAGLADELVGGRVDASRVRFSKLMDAVEHRGTLGDRQLLLLREWATCIEAECARPMDVEFAFVGDEFHLLQLRPITGVLAVERERVRQDIIAELQQQPDIIGAFWRRGDFSEQLETATPMTWSLLGPMFRSDGALANLARDFGAMPDDTLGDLGGYDLIAGRVRQHPQRALHLVQRDPLFGYDIGVMRPSPTAAASIQNRGGMWAMLRKLRAAWRYTTGLKRRLKTFKRDYYRQHLPNFRRVLRDASDIPLSLLNAPGLLAAFERVRTATVVEFAQQAFQPAAFADYLHSTGQLHRTAPVALPMEYDLLQQRTEAELRAHFGHRGENAMELAAPRWSERDDLTSMLPATPGITRLHPMLALREMAKHEFLRGLAFLRRVLLELDARWNLGGGIFHLKQAELREEGARELVEARRRRCNIELSLELPDVLFGDDLEAIGRPATRPPHTALWHGLPVMRGVASGPACLDPCDVRPGCIIVCRSLDPALVAVYQRCAGVVAEVGGALSHGAIVLRELGVPTVVGVPGITEVIAAGAMLYVDGTTGTVSVPT